MKPKIIIAQVEGSGTAEMVAATDPVTPAPPPLVFQMSEANQRLLLPSKASRLATCRPWISKVSLLNSVATPFPCAMPLASNVTAYSNDRLFPLVAKGGAR